ncbi:YwiC-like family protein [Streptomyces sp. NBC_00249]|uniref:YwiC-like family protein n=1 Tax=Streptomyces sp. NBC_00249 TaxID=2975690 RepID=UPI002256842E|nr:YwiC-like family protein [Streptomyces sp. NBC_00249]MCX5194531.1 YwiC-like family protein [Streptomyces sp. NBC_00249]
MPPLGLCPGLPALVCGAGCTAAGLPLALAHPWLPLAAVGAAPFVAVNTRYAWRGRERALANGLAAALCAAAALSPWLAVPFAAYLARAVGLPGRGLRPAMVGATELACSAALLTALLLVFRGGVRAPAARSSPPPRPFPKPGLRPGPPSGLRSGPGRARAPDPLRARAPDPLRGCAPDPVGPAPRTPLGAAPRTPFGSAPGPVGPAPGPSGRLRPGCGRARARAPSGRWPGLVGSGRGPGVGRGSCAARWLPCGSGS